MPLWDEDEDTIVKVVIGSAVGMTIGFGVCGLGAITGAGEHPSLAYVAIAGSVLFFVCGAILFVSLLVLLGRGLVRIFRGRNQ